MPKRTQGLHYTTRQTACWISVDLECGQNMGQDASYDWEILQAAQGRNQRG